MPEALDIPIIIYGAIFDALEDDAAWSALIPEGNRIRLDNPVDAQRSNKPIIADADAASARMRLRSGATGLKTDNVTFGTYSEEGDPDTLEKMSFIFRLRLVSQLMSENESSTLVTETLRVIRGLGSRLGLPYVTGVKTRWETDEKPTGGGEEEGEDSFIRQVTEMDILVDVEVDPNTLQEQE